MQSKVSVSFLELTRIFVFITNILLLTTTMVLLNMQ